MNIDFDKVAGIVKYQIIRLILCGKVTGSRAVRFSRKATIKARKGAHIVIGFRVSMSANSVVSATENADITIGAGTGINYNTVVVARKKINIGNNVLIGPNVAIYDHNHIFNQKEQMKDLGYKTASVIIEDNVWIGANVVILKGVTIGTGSVISAGTIISENIPANSLVTMKRELSIAPIEYR